jgi:hypothetical protein
MFFRLHFCRKLYIVFCRFAQDGHTPHKGRRQFWPDGMNADKPQMRSSVKAFRIASGGDLP